MKPINYTMFAKGVAKTIQPANALSPSEEASEAIHYSHTEGKHELKIPLKSGLLIGSIATLFLVLALVLVLK